MQLAWLADAMMWLTAATATVAAELSTLPLLRGLAVRAESVASTAVGAGMLTTSGNTLVWPLLRENSDN